MRYSSKINIAVTSLIVLLMASGCIPIVVGAVAGAGGVTYLRGTLVKNVPATVPELHEATLEAFKTLKMYVVEDKLEKRTAKVKAEYEDGKTVNVFIDALTEYATKITIRVGVFGDQDESLAILGAIEEKL